MGAGTHQLNKEVSYTDITGPVLCSFFKLCIQPAVQFLQFVHPIENGSYALLVQQRVG